MIIVLFGPGGVGKDAILTRLVAQDPRLWLSRSWTTRPRRLAEPADAYTFVDRPTFIDRIAAGGFLEWDEHLGHLYGTPIPDAPADKDIVLKPDVNGAFSLRQQYPDALVILILPPSQEALEQRLLQRGDDPLDVEARLRRADMEMEKGRAIADHIVVNDDLSRAVQEVAGIIERHRNSRSGGTP